MGKWFKQFEALIWAASIALATLAYTYQSFATKEYVDTKHESVMDVLNRIDANVKLVEQRTYDLNGKEAREPAVKRGP